MSETDTMTLADWLLEQIAEDEAVAESVRALQDHGEDRWWVDGPAEKSRKWWVYATGEKFNHEAIATHIARHDPARVLAECKAKRRIVDDLSRFISNADTMGARKDHPTLLAGLERQLLYLAQPYADRPGWREEWVL